MKYGPLGRSGLIVSRICLGGNSWCSKGRRGWGKFDEAEAPAYATRISRQRIAIHPRPFTRTTLEGHMGPV